MSKLRKAIDWVVSSLISFLILWILVAAVFAINKYLNGPINPSNNQQGESSGIEVVQPNIPDLSSAASCIKRSLSGDIAKFFPVENYCNQRLYSDYKVFQIMKNEQTPNAINLQTITEKAKHIQINGDIDKLYMYVSASVLDEQYAPLRKNAVYFLIDGGNYQGYLDATKISGSELASTSSGVFLSKDSPKIFIKELDKPILVSAHGVNSTGISKVNFIDKFTQGSHLIYAYVSKPVYGIINDLSIAYTCKKQGCNVSLSSN